MRSLGHFLSVLLALVLLASCGSDSGGPSMTSGDTTTQADVAGADSSGPCVPNCNGKSCGSSGCPGYSCGLCGEGMYCNEEFQCAVGVCTAGASKCVEGGVATCAEDGMSWAPPEACAEGLVCEDGACVPDGEGCEPGVRICLDGGVAICTAEGVWGESVPCEAGEVCEDGECAPAAEVCSPGSFKCENGKVRECNEAGSGWGQPLDCPQGTECQEGICVPATPETCSEVFLCMAQKNCGDPEAGCMSDCFDDASDGALVLAMALYDCMFENCGKWGPSEPCFQTQQTGACAAELAACTKDACEPQCAGKECGSDGCGGSCGTCPEGVACQAGQCVGGDECGDLGYEGCCDGQTLVWCEEGELKSQDCSWKPKCGWNGQKGYYDCGTQGAADPSGTLPLACDGSCVPDCTGKECGEDGCGGSCGGCPVGQACENGVCQGGGDGNGCSDMIFCFIDCGFEQSCLGPCYDVGDTQGKNLFQSLMTCVTNICGMYISQGCLYEAIDGACKQNYQACMAD